MQRRALELRQRQAQSWSADALGISPLAVVPAAAAASFLSLGIAGLTLAQLLGLRSLIAMAWRRTRRVSRTLSRNMSRIISDKFLDATTPRAKIVMRSFKIGSVFFSLCAAWWTYKVQRAMKASLALMNEREEELDKGSMLLMEALLGRPKWGTGLPQPPPAGEWRRALYPDRSAKEMLSELHMALGVVTRRPSEMTLDQLTEGVRRLLLRKYRGIVNVTDKYWSETQAQAIAEALAHDAGMKFPLAEGGMEEVSPSIAFPPWPCPRWLKLSQRVGIAALRPIFLDVWGFTSRYVDTPLGRMHVYDSADATQDRPPLILQHGMFVTGWSMMLLAWVLVRRGRRVVVPELFDFDHGLSKSKGSPDKRVRNPILSVDALMFVVDDLMRGGAREFDIAGHSFGGFVVGKLAKRCAAEGKPLRKVILLGPGGPPCRLYSGSQAVRALADPRAAVKQAPLPGFLQRQLRVVVGWSLAVLLSPNNINLVFGGMHHSEYFGSTGYGSPAPTLLLWGDEDTIAWPRPPEALGKQMREAFPSLTAYWVTGGSHNIQLDSVVSVAQAMHTWLDSGSVETQARASSWHEMLLAPSRRKLVPMDFSAGSQQGVAKRESSREKHQARL